MAGLVPAIHVLLSAALKTRARMARDTHGHDGEEVIQSWQKPP
jgi:hypothetical protein